MASGDSLRPISLRVWAGKLEREKGCGPFAVLDDRNGFLDIRVCCQNEPDVSGWMLTIL